MSDLSVIYLLISLRGGKAFFETGQQQSLVTVTQPISNIVMEFYTVSMVCII